MEVEKMKSYHRRPEKKLRKIDQTEKISYRQRQN